MAQRRKGHKPVHSSEENYTTREAKSKERSSSVSQYSRNMPTGLYICCKNNVMHSH